MGDPLAEPPGAIETALRTGVAVLVLPLVLLVHSLAAIAAALGGARPASVHRLYLSTSRWFLRVGGTRLLVHGQERVQAGQAYVVVPNHESGWDPFCVMAALPDLVVRFIAKRQFMDIPVVGHALRLTGNVRVERTRTRQDVARIHTVMDRRAPEISILFFAEGTRARDGALHRFKMGAFATALGYRLPILPIGIAGARPVWTATVFRLRRGTVAIEVGEPIPVEGLSEDDREGLRDRTFAAVRELRTTARQRLRDARVDPGGID